MPMEKLRKESRFSFCLDVAPQVTQVYHPKGFTSAQCHDCTILPQISLDL